MASRIFPCLFLKIAVFIRRKTVSTYTQLDVYKYVFFYPSRFRFGRRFLHIFCKCNESFGRCKGCLHKKLPPGVRMAVFGERYGGLLLFYLRPICRDTWYIHAWCVGEGTCWGHTIQPIIQTTICRNIGSQHGYAVE